MISREEILKNEAFWVETIQNKIYNDLASYIKEKKISSKELAKKLGVSKGRVSQIMSGNNLNFRIDTLVKISLAIGKIPDFKLENMDAFIERDRRSEHISIIYNKSFVDLKDFNKSLTYTSSSVGGKIIPLNILIDSDELVANINRPVIAI